MALLPSLGGALGLTTTARMSTASMSAQSVHVKDESLVFPLAGTSSAASFHKSDEDVSVDVHAEVCTDCQGVDQETVHTNSLTHMDDEEKYAATIGGPDGLSLVAGSACVEEGVCVLQNPTVPEAVSVEVSDVSFDDIFDVDAFCADASDGYQSDASYEGSGRLQRSEIRGGSSASRAGGCTPLCRPLGSASERKLLYKCMSDGQSAVRSRTHRCGVCISSPSFSSAVCVRFRAQFARPLAVWSAGRPTVCRLTRLADRDCLRNPLPPNIHSNPIYPTPQSVLVCHICMHAFSQSAPLSVVHPPVVLETFFIQFH